MGSKWYQGEINEAGLPHGRGILIHPQQDFVWGWFVDGTPTVCQHSKIDVHGSLTGFEALKVEAQIEATREVPEAVPEEIG